MRTIRTRRQTGKAIRTSQATLNRRFREIWLDGWGCNLITNGMLTSQNILQLRSAMEALVKDKEYWDGLIEIIRFGELQREIKRRMMNRKEAK